MGGYWLNDTHWFEYDATLTDSPPSKKKRKEDPRPHASGSARTEGYYKLDSKEKAKHTSQDMLQKKPTVRLKPVLQYI